MGRNLRNPFRVMVTVRKTHTGRPICKPLKHEPYFPTYNDAYAVWWPITKIRMNWKVL